MRKWETVLARDTEASDDLIDWLRTMRERAYEELLRCEASKHDRVAGVVEGINRVLFQVTANREERKWRNNAA